MGSYHHRSLGDLATIEAKGLQFKAYPPCAGAWRGHNRWPFGLDRQKISSLARQAESSARACGVMRSPRDKLALRRGARILQKSA